MNFFKNEKILNFEKLIFLIFLNQKFFLFWDFWLWFWADLQNDLAIFEHFGQFVNWGFHKKVDFISRSVDFILFIIKRLRVQIRVEECLFFCRSQFWLSLFGQLGFGTFGQFVNWGFHKKNELFQKWENSEFWKINFSNFSKSEVCFILRFLALILGGAWKMT